MATKSLAGSNSENNGEKYKPSSSNRGGIHDDRVMATLEKDEKGWFLQSISNSGGNVDLNTRQWVGSTDVKNCFRGFIGLTEGSCVDENFASGYPGITNIILVPVVWPLGLIFEIPLILSGKFVDDLILPLYIERNFSSSKFNDALEQAINRDGGANLYNSVQNNYKKILSEAREADYRLSVMRAGVVQYEREMQELAERSFKTRIVDKSGLWRGGNTSTEQGVADFFLEKQNVPLLNYTYINTQTPCRDALMATLFPAENIRDLDLKLTSAYQNIKDIASAQEIDAANTREYIDKRSATFEVKDKGLLKSIFKSKGINVHVNLPGQMQITSGVPVAGYQGEVAIISKDFKGIVPSNYDYSNSEMSVVVNGSTIYIENKTNTYISIDALTMYYNDSSITIGGESLREIAPETTINLTTSSFALPEMATNYYDITLDKAKNTKITYGFACKYRRNDLNQARSFIDKKAYRLYDLLEKRNLLAVNLD